jgi:hypothetical protein
VALPSHILRRLCRPCSAAIILLRGLCKVPPPRCNEGVFRSCRLKVTTLKYRLNFLSASPDRHVAQGHISSFLPSNPIQEASQYPAFQTSQEREDA